MPQGKVLITGGTGFIGFQLVKYLLLKGYSIRVLARSSSPNLAKLTRLNVEVVIGDITQYYTIESAFSGINKVFHCAGYVSDWGSKEDYENTNVTGLKNVLDACVKNGVQRFIAISTNDVFGIIEDQKLDESFPLKQWNEPYPDSKIAADKLIWKYYKEFDLPVSISYPCWVYGPEDTTFVPHLVDAIRTGSFLYWRKEAHFYPTYIDNLLDQLHVISEKKEAIGNGYLIHDGSSILLKSFCDKISESLGYKKVKLFVPYFLAYWIASIMEGVWRILNIKSRPLLTTYVVKNFGSKINYSQEKARKELGWAPHITFEEGFEKTMKWIKNNQNL